VGASTDHWSMEIAPLSDNLLISLRLTCAVAEHKKCNTEPIPLPGELMKRLSWVAVGMCLMMAACGDSNVDSSSPVEDEAELRPTCGDGVCRKRESCSSCAADCGVCAPTPSTTPAYNCATFEGLNVYAAGVSYHNVSLRSGESITVRVSAYDQGDQIMVWVAEANNSLSVTFLSADAAKGLTFTGTGSVYNFGWTMHTVAGTGSQPRTWSFDCSSL